MSRAMSALLGAVGLAAAALLAGCGTDQGGTRADGAAATPTVSAPAATASSASSSARAAAPAADPAGGTTGRCRTADLDLRLGTGRTTEGTRRVNLVLTNRSTRACTMTGYPAVSWVTADDIQVNDSFETDPEVAGRTVTLTPGRAAHAVLVLHAAAEYDEATCRPVKVRGVRVAPPRDTAGTVVDDPQVVCSVAGVNLAQVQPVGAGA